MEIEGSLLLVGLCPVSAIIQDKILVHIVDKSKILPEIQMNMSCMKEGRDKVRRAI